MSDISKLIGAILLLWALLIVSLVFVLRAEPFTEPDYESHFIRGYESGYMAGSQDCFSAVEQSGWTQTWGDQ